ncbi:hypothetical protein TSUD_296840 [Trifolium subterraneum]|uniref:F-box associated beta-propeller type 1 domain-containing protein n=1 Tax=Trifolium subterraneum TaxID=3900 RepID=A0A2Z6PIC6_TRISU|nr:hypothetical protein TSUD_296840 [Trifolium subterraneum]
MVSKYHSLYNEAHTLLNHLDSTDLQWKLHLLSGERFENKVQLNWPFKYKYNYGLAIWPKILGSAINGTLCIYNFGSQSNIVLWNPVTEELNIVPENEARFSDEHEFSYTIHGFGYDHVSDDYKIIQHVVYSGVFKEYWQQVPPGPYWDIYSLRSNSWKKLYVDMHTRCNSSIGVYLNGMCHWWWVQSCRSTISESTVRETYVVSFNLSNELPVTTLLPDDVHGLECTDRELAVLNGHVAMISKYVKTTSFHISISILGEPSVKESWIKLFDVESMSCIDHPIGAGKEGHIFFKINDDELACLDLTTGIIENIGVKAKKWCAQIVIYKKSTLPIKGTNK